MDDDPDLDWYGRLLVQLWLAGVPARRPGIDGPEILLGAPRRMAGRCREAGPRTETGLGDGR